MVVGDKRARSSAQFVSQCHPSLMVNDITLVTKWLRIIDPGTIALGSAPPSPSLPLAATSMSFGHQALWNLKNKLCKCFILDF